MVNAILSALLNEAKAKLRRLREDREIRVSVTSTESSLSIKSISSSNITTMSAISSVDSGDPMEVEENGKAANDREIASNEDDGSTSSGDDDDSGDSDDDSGDSDDASDSDSDENNGDGDDASSIAKEPVKKGNHLPLMKLPLQVARPSLPTSGAKSQHPKMRIKLSLKLPTKANAPPRSDVQSESDEDVKATVVESDEEGESVTAVVAESSSTFQPTKKPKASKQIPVPATSKRRSINPTKPIKMPPIQSPGLLMVAPSSSHANSLKVPGASSIIPPSYSINKDGFTTPRSVFEETMKIAGYSYERRAEVPHRGSSVERVVDDMFDSNVKLALHIPAFVPPELFPQDEFSDSDDVSDEAKKDSQRSTDLIKSMIDALKPDTKGQHETLFEGKSSRKRRRPWSFKEMIPVSLTMNFPRTYVERRKAYNKQVHKRERAIVALQEAEEQEELNGTTGNESIEKGNIVIPPIPDPPSPPHLSECTTDDSDYKDIYNDDAHPIYIPKGREKCVAHLDEKCFHVTNGRYFGLVSNMISDPNFVGPNAPGIAGVSASAGAGLATSTTGTTATAFLVSSFQNTCATDLKVEVKRKSLDTSSKKDGPNNLSEDTFVARGSSGSKQHNNTYANELKKGKEAGDVVTESTRTEIIKAAIHAARSNQHGQSFQTPNGQTFPDVSKAFAMYAGIKPCERCKSNKQGVRFYFFPVL